MPVELKPNDRYAIVGKTRSGKTQFTTTLATTIVAQVNKRTEGEPWMVWWIDTKGDPKDIERLRRWGYVRVKRLANNDVDGPEIYRYFKVEPASGEETVAPEVAIIARSAYNHKGGRILVVVDEFAQCIFSSRRMGPALRDLEQRGGGKMVGFMGQTQEPVDIPRQLLSQATHLFIFQLTFQRDIEYMRKGYCPEYELPSKMGAPHGFWYRHIDNPKNLGWRFFRHEREFYEWITGGGNKAA